MLFMRNKENKKPLINQLNRTIGNFKTIPGKLHADVDIYAMHVQLMAIRAGLNKSMDKLLPDFISTEINAILKSLLASKLYDQTHRDCFLFITSNFEKHSLLKKIKIYDLLRKNYPQN